MFRALYYREYGPDERQTFRPNTNVCGIRGMQSTFNIYVTEVLCSTIVLCVQVLRNEKTFTEIMRCYRLQPQADSHVYRSVLMHKTKPEERMDKPVVTGTNGMFDS